MRLCITRHLVTSFKQGLAHFSHLSVYLGAYTNISIDVRYNSDLNDWVESSDPWQLRSGFWNRAVQFRWKGRKAMWMNITFKYSQCLIRLHMRSVAIIHTYFLLAEVIKTWNSKFNNTASFLNIYSFIVEKPSSFLCKRTVNLTFFTQIYILLLTEV